MAEEKKNKDNRPAWRRRFNYQWIVKNIPFFLFVSALMVVYIYNGHYSDKTIKNINRTNRELKELQYEYKSVRGVVLDRSKQSELIEAVQPLGLKELTSAPVILIDSSSR